MSSVLLWNSSVFLTQWGSGGFAALTGEIIPLWCPRMSPFWGAKVQNECYRCMKPDLSSLAVLWPSGRLPAASVPGASGEWGKHGQVLFRNEGVLGSSSLLCSTFLLLSLGCCDAQASLPDSTHSWIFDSSGGVFSFLPWSETIQLAKLSQEGLVWRGGKHLVICSGPEGHCHSGHADGYGSQPDKCSISDPDKVPSQTHRCQSMWEWKCSIHLQFPDTYARNLYKNIMSQMISHCNNTISDTSGWTKHCYNTFSCFLDTADRKWKITFLFLFGPSVLDHVQSTLFWNIPWSKHQHAEPQRPVTNLLFPVSLACSEVSFPAQVLLICSNGFPFISGVCIWVQAGTM